MIKIDVPYDPNKDADIIVWVLNCDNALWPEDFGTVVFFNEADAIIFRLTFGF